MLFNLAQLQSSGIIDYLKEQLGNPAIVVFGSYARGEDTDSSDIDIFIASASKKKVSFERFEKKLHRPIQIFRYAGITHIKNKELANNIINGITLHGFVEAFR